MRALFHLIATVALTPYVVLALAFVLFGRAVAAGSWLRFFDTLITQASWVIPWGAIVFALFVVSLAILGFTGMRWLGGIVLCALAAVSLIVLTVMPSSPIDADTVVVLSPCAVVAVFGGWIAYAECKGSATKGLQARP